MDGKRWHRARELFAEALDRDDPERGAFLDQACAGDAELRQMVERLFVADASAPSLLGVGPDQLALLLEDDAEPAPSRLGPYEILERAGQGGMGTVFRARRADGRFERDVALKVIRTDIDPDEPLRRFRTESRLLARLEHPNIARLYDAGVEGGRPFLVMEFVRGERIDRYCDARQLSVRDRLAHFERVCEAVQHAHQNLVIHRDLKPSNILIMENGQVKLLDFGIAKLVADEAGPDADDTRTGFRAMTLEYASPEQIRGDPVTTASDVYSLGVVLFELLTGRRPYQEGPGPLDTARAVLDTEPSRPSGVVTRDDGPAAPAASASTASAEQLATLRSSTPEALARRLWGDLDTIMLRALQKEPARRYPSVQMLLDDIRRHLAGLPVLARPDTLGYRLGKFARRNWVSVAAVGAVVAALAVGLAVALWQANLAATQRDLARVEAVKANRITDFLVSVFAAADPSEGRADTLRAAQLLDRGAARVEAELSAEPAVQATMMDVMGRVYTSLSLYDRADSLLNRGWRQRVALLGDEHADVATSVHHLANLAFLRGQPAAESLYRVAVDSRRRALGPNDPLVAESLIQLAYAVLGAKNDTAEAALDEAERIYRTSGTDEVGLAEVTYARGFIRHDEGRYDEAERLYREALAIQRARLGPNHPTTLTTTSNLGLLLQLVGRYEAADSALQAVLAARREVFGEKHAEVARSLLALAELRYVQGAYPEAERFAREALALRTELNGAGSRSATSASFFVARVLQAEGKFEAAESLYHDLLTSASERGAAGNFMARMLNDYAGVLETRGDVAGAETFYRRALQLYRKEAGPDHPFTAIVQGNVAATLLDQGKLDEAEPMFRATIETLRAAWKDGHQSVGVARLQLGTLLMQKRELPEAEVMLREALGVIEAALPPGHWRVGQARLRLGACLADMGRVGEAETLLRSSFAVLEPQRRVRFGDWRQLLAELAELSTALNRPDSAAHYRELLRAAPARRPLR